MMEDLYMCACVVVVVITSQRIENNNPPPLVFTVNKVKTKTPEVPYGNLFTVTIQKLLVCVCTPLVI